MSLVASVLAVIPLLGTLGAVGTLRLSDATTTYLRSRIEGEGAAFDLDTLPALDVALVWRTAQLRLSYAPRLTVRNVLGPDDSELLVVHGATGTFELRGRRSRLTLAQTLSMGRWPLGNLNMPQNSDPTAPPNPTTPQLNLLPSAQSLRVISEQTSASGSYLWTRRLRSELRASYGVFGGADAAARALQPRQRTAAVSSSLVYALLRRQELDSALGVAQISTSNGFQHWIVEAGEGWSSRWTRDTSTRLSLGVFAYDSHRPDDARKSGARPAASASFHHDLLRHRTRSGFALGGAVAPIVNPLTGELQTVVQGTTTASLRRERSELSLSLDALQTLPPDAVRATQLFGASARFLRQVNELVELSAGARVQRQELVGSTFSLPWQWVVQAGVLVHSEPIRF